MTSIYDLYEYYLEPRDLKDQAHLVQVESAKVQEMFNPRSPKKDRKVVLRFVKRRKAMILNKTQAGQMMEICGSDDIAKWLGKEVVLVAGRASNGRETIIICSRENSGDIDIAYPAGWNEQYKQLCKKLRVPADAAAQVLAQCENDYRTATERLQVQFRVN